MAISKVVLIGANGNLGPSVLSALLEANFSVTVISRHGSKSTYPPNVKVEYMSNDPSVSELVPILKGQDALVTTFGGTHADIQITLADACVQAQVQRFIPADFGSCDSSTPFNLEMMPLYIGKKRVREYLTKLANQNQLTWTSIVCGHFFDYGLNTGLLLLDPTKLHATILDGGDIPWSATTLARTGLAVVRVLQRPSATENKMMYIQSFNFTQNQLLALVEKTTGKKWTVEQADSMSFIKQNKAKLDKDPSDFHASESFVGALGIIDGNWTSKPTFANDILGFDDEDLEAAVQKALS